MHWDNVQLSLFDPVHLGNTTFDVNGPSFSSKAPSSAGRARDRRSHRAGIGLLERLNPGQLALLSSTYQLRRAIRRPSAPCISQINGTALHQSVRQLGTSRAPSSPAQEFNIRARYDFSSGTTSPSCGWVRTTSAPANQPASLSDRYSHAESVRPRRIASTRCRDTRPTMRRSACPRTIGRAQIIGSNLSNSDASMNTSSGQYIESQVPLRPRVLMPSSDKVRRRDAARRGTHAAAAPGCAAAAATTSAATTSAAAPAAARAAGSGAGAQRREFRDGFSEAQARIDLDPGWRRGDDPAVPLLEGRHPRLHRLGWQAGVQREALRAARDRREGLPRGAWRCRRAS